MMVYVCTLEPDHANSTVVGVAVSMEEAKTLGDQYARKPLRWVRRLGDDSWSAQVYEDPRMGIEGFEVWPFDLTGYDDA